MPSGPKPTSKHRLLIRHQWALGDTVLLTALVRDLHLAYPREFEISVETHWTPVWWRNPHIFAYRQHQQTPNQIVTVAWGDAIRWNSRVKLNNGRRDMRHILAWYHYDFERQTGIHVPVTEPRGELFLDKTESQPVVEGRYWVIFSGGKLDITNKHWDVDRYQQVVDRLRDRGLRFVQCGATHQNNVHPPLKDCLNLIGKTDNVRDLFALIKHCDGVICPVTAAMHIAAVYEKPCVVLAGGREEPWFEWYGNGFEGFTAECQPVRVPHKFLHTLGHLACCDVQGCWKRRTVPLEPADLSNSKRRNDLCKEPVRLPSGQAIAGCMNLITPDHVVQAVMEYYDEKILPPVQLDNTQGSLPEAPTPAPAPVPVSAPPPAPPMANGAPLLQPIPVAGPPGIQMLRLPTTEVQPPCGILPSPYASLAQGITTPMVPPITEPAVVREPTVVREPSLPARAQRQTQQKPPIEYAQPLPNGTQHAIFDHPTIGGRFTVCVLCYGPYPDLAKRCISSILTTIPRERIDLRIATNEVSADTLDFVRSVGPDHLYVNTHNRKKYPVMRDIFFDSQAPLRTNYLIWFDDDAQAVDPLWAVRLAETIVNNHKHGCRLYGDKRFHDLTIYAKGGHRPDRWFQEAAWHRGVQLRLRNSERTAPNGSCVDFVVGWFWAIGTDAIRVAGIPDSRLNHNGGDITIGAQVIQSGFKIKEFNKNKSLVWCPTKEQGGRRGYEEQFPWSKAIR